MKTIRNKTPRPIRITLAGGKVLHLGPARTGQIGDEAVTRASVQALLQAGTIEVIDEGGGPSEGPGPQRGGPVATRGHHRPGTGTGHKGDR